MCASSLRWHERLSDFLRNVRFQPFKTEPKTLMRKSNNKEDMCYEHISACLNDLSIVSKSSQIITYTLINNHELKLKGTRPISYHLGSDFTRDSNNELCLAPHEYIDKMSESYASIFSSK